MKNKKTVVLILAFVFLIGSSFTFEFKNEFKTGINSTILVDVVGFKFEGELPMSKGIISDYEGLLTKKQIKILSKKIKKHKKSTTNQIAILTVDNFGSYSNIDDFALAVFNKWGIGLKDINNGILVVVSKKSRTVRISTGTGIEKILTDEEAKQINEKIMIPHFKKGNYFEGINTGLDAIIKELLAK